jgi:hypothetical protein
MFIFVITSVVFLCGWIATLLKLGDSSHELRYEKGLAKYWKQMYESKCRNYDILWNEVHARTGTKKPPPPPKPKSHWEILGINKTNDKALILRAFRKLAMKYHPDHGGKQEDFVKLKKAYHAALDEMGLPA